jgi:hypothetical protein
MFFEGRACVDAGRLRPTLSDDVKGGEDEVTTRSEN